MPDPKGRSSDFKPRAFPRQDTKLPSPSRGLSPAGAAAALTPSPVTLWCSQRSPELEVGLPLLTDDREGARGLCRAEGVGDLTNVGATVLSP